ncbi:MAG: hypothetical protein JWO67_3751, partial [Streptosporangiaceae bacterium]|nr:hypothetical protein [Streptosporangiaceae bacterium]
KFGQYAVAEPFRADRIHFHTGTTPLREVDHEPPVPVLDQEDLIAQGIDTTSLVPGAKRVDALGSCTCNAGTVSLAERVAAARGTAALAEVQLTTPHGKSPGLSGNEVLDEEFAILLYNLVTDQTGNPAQEWPPTDCGSTGLYVATELEHQGLISGHKTASGMENVCSLLQDGTVLMGAPWFNAWMEPDAQGFVDGDGSLTALLRAIESGVAGGHETCLTALERLVLTRTGGIDLRASHVRVRNSWSPAFADHGSYRVRLSTLAWLGSHADFKQFVI